MMDKSLLYQVIALLVNNIGSLGSGIGFGYMGPYGQQVMLELGMDDSLHSWLVGSVSIGGLMGCLLAGKLADIIGRKRASLIYFSINIIGWSLVTFSLSSTMIFSGRTLHGLGEGMAVVITIIYLGELTQERHRGGAIASLTVAACFGIALAYLLGVFFTWRVSAGIVAILNFLTLLCLTTLPESPLWLATNNKLKQGLEALEKIGAGSGAEELNNQLTESKVSNEPSTIQTGVSLATIISTVIPPLLLFLFPISGVYSVSFFAIHLAESMHIGHPSAVAIAVGLMRTLGASIGTGFVQRFGRRKSMIISAGLTTLFLVSLFFLLLAKSLKFPIPESIFNWATVILLLVTMFASSLGMAPVPWILAGEWPAFTHKGLVGTAGTALFYISVFLASQLTGFLQQALGLPGMFLVFALNGSIYVGLVMIFVPETNGKNYHQFVEEAKAALKI